VINIIIHLIINTTLSLEERPSKSVWRLQAFKNIYVEVYNCTHTDTKDEPPYPCLNKGCLKVPTFPKFGQKCSRKGSISSRVMLPRSTQRHPRASFTNKPVVISYLACRPHLRHVVCMGGYSDSLSQWTVLNYSMSYVTRDPTVTVTLPLAWVEVIKIDHQLKLPNWSGSLVKLSK